MFPEEKSSTCLLQYKHQYSYLENRKKINIGQFFNKFGYRTNYTYCHPEIVPSLLECQEAPVLN